MAIAAAIALVALLLSPGSASAWDQYPCTVGGLDAAAATVNPETGAVTLPGIVKCGVDTPGREFVIAVFDRGGVYGKDKDYYYTPR
jgi:hypothetical protein